MVLRISYSSSITTMLSFKAIAFNFSAGVRQRDDECGSFALGAFERDSATAGINRTLDNGHANACSLNLPHIVRSAKRLKQPALVLFGDPNASDPQRAASLPSPSKPDRCVRFRRCWNI